MKNDSSSLELYRNSVQKLEKERIELQDKINTLEKAVSESAVPKHNNNNIDISLSGKYNKLYITCNIHNFYLNYFLVISGLFVKHTCFSKLFELCVTVTKC